ncbi:hypothetical protein Lfu02_39750 [Longispora fulva]|uniref:helix-turn-helix domain-containing protein n=1 Tax=Longispora fulva TaxID=619741 RepID=UPI001A3945B1|nr:helix-turn-helix domain-containing protein [Longispora fulva]GIG59603.1 hypothetical protein Lfu02_39750 [Longispora fulva]
MLEQPAFGRRLRHLRLLRGMSQAQLAGGEVSPSYISLVESGRRTPGDQIAQVIAERLGIPITEFDPAAPTDQGQRSHLVGLLLAARGARREGDSRFAAEQLRIVADGADALGEEDVAWEARWELAETHGDLSAYADKASVLTELLDRPLTAGSARLRSRLITALADLALCRGHLSEAVRLAEEAMAAADTLERGTPERVRARLILVATYTDRGDLDRASTALTELLDGYEDLPNQQLRGLASWVAADLYAAQERHPEALVMYDRAAEVLSPRVDLRLSARLSLATAAAVLTAGSDLGRVHDLLRRVRQAFELIGTEADLVRLVAVEAGAFLAGGDVPGALARVAEIADAPDLPPHELASCLMAAGLVQQVVGGHQGAEKSYRRAAELFDDVGAFRKSAAAWRTLADLLSARATA